MMPARASRDPGTGEPGPGAPVLSVCVVNHKTPDLTAACLRSIAATAGDLPVELLVVNNTPDDTARLEAVLAETGARLAGCRLLGNARPLGFAANQNQLLALATGRYLLPLNSDTEVTPGALAALVAFMEAHPGCGIAGPRLVHPDGSLQRSCRNFPTPLTHWLEASGLWQLLARTGPLARRLGRRYYLLGAHDAAVQVDWLSAACLIVRADAYRQVGGFDAVQFAGMYGEDIDWCLRMRRAGWQVWFTPAATIVHAESASPMDRRTVQMYRGFYHFCALHYAPRTQAAMRWATRLALGPRRLLARSAQRRAVYDEILALPVQ